MISQKEITLRIWEAEMRQFPCGAIIIIIFSLFFYFTLHVIVFALWILFCLADLLYIFLRLRKMEMYVRGKK